MQLDFHYYGTYCAAFLAGFSHEESLQIAYSAQFVDCCSRTILKKVKAPLSAATTQLQGELMDARTDLSGLQDITRIWSSFHFLPYDLYADVKALSPVYKSKYRLICKPNGTLVADTVKLAKDRDLESVGIAMHILADTWAHANFAGTPSHVINNINYDFYEVLVQDGETIERHIAFRHNPTAPDDLEKGLYTNTMNNGSENSIMVLGHGRAGHLPDYSFMRYKYLPAWGNYECVFKDNPSDYRYAFGQMIYAMKYLRGNTDHFELACYDFQAIEAYEDRLEAILTERRPDACEAWKAFGEELSGCEIPDFDINTYQRDYKNASKAEKDATPMGRFLRGALRQKSMVVERIYSSRNLLAGISVNYTLRGFGGIRDFKALLKDKKEGEKS